MKTKTLYRKNVTELKWLLIVSAFFFLVSLLAMGIIITKYASANLL
ncbi:hypothetical protein [Pareuzebyella sediminis]|nr:hypothetical protein [Pareuzebyella sediminis]